jgi:hypothetical protein
LPQVAAMVKQRSDKGIVLARHAVQLRPENVNSSGPNPGLSRSTGSRTRAADWPEPI